MYPFSCIISEFVYYYKFVSLISRDFFSSFDSVKILPVPKPIGGILVFSVNALFFLNQGIPPYAVSLNSLGDTAMEGIARKLFHITFTGCPIWIVRKVNECCDYVFGVRLQIYAGSVCIF